MRAEEMRDGGALLGNTLGEVGLLARDVHLSLTGRVFGLLGPAARPVQVLHDAISVTAYTSSALGARVVPGVAAAIAARTRAVDGTPLDDDPRGRFAISAITGIWGDRIAEGHASLAPAMSLRTHDGVLRRVPADVVHDVEVHDVEVHDVEVHDVEVHDVEAHDVEAHDVEVHDVDAATGHIVVFVHGLCEHDGFWWYGARRNWGHRDTTYGSTLRAERGWTPLYARYNTGLHISQNGRLLADYLDTLVARWPVPVTEIALVGHSMGGLVARSASHHGEDRGQTWVTALRHVVGLGTPHLGAPLERWVNDRSHGLRRLPETRRLARLIDQRSAGVQDLRHGSVSDEDWAGLDPDERIDHCTPARLMPGVAYSMVSATLSARPDGRFGHDLLVEHVSAHGTGRPGASRRIGFEVDRLLHLGGRTHFHLLDDPAVYRQLCSWLDGADGADEPGPPVPPTTAT